MEQGETVEFSGHTFTFEGLSVRSDAVKSSVVAAVRIDGEQVYEPSRSKYLAQGMDIGTPSVKTGVRHDLYLTLEGNVRPDDTQARIKVFVKPLILWLWIGGGLVALGTVLAALPNRRRPEVAEPSSAEMSSARGSMT